MRCACKVTIKFRQRAQNGHPFRDGGHFSGGRGTAGKKRTGGQSTSPGRREHGSRPVGNRIPGRRYPSSRPPVSELPAARRRIRQRPRRESCSHRDTEDTEKEAAPVRRGREDWREREEEGKREGRESRFLIPAYTFSGRPGFTGCRAGTPVKNAASIKERTDRDRIHRE